MKRIIDKIRDNLEIREIIILMLLPLILWANSYINPEIVKIENTTLITGELKAKPNYTASNGNNVENITFEMIGYEKDFRVSGCALSMISKYELIRLEAGAKLELRVSKEELKEEKSFFIKSISVLEIKTKSEEILSLENLNYCKKDSWKGYRKIAVTFLILLVLFGLMGWSKSKS